MRIARRRTNAAMSEQDLNDAQVGAGLERVGSEVMTENVRRDGFRQAGLERRAPQRLTRDLGRAPSLESSELSLLPCKSPDRRV
jgi:hypothetical protein